MPSIHWLASLLVVLAACGTTAPKAVTVVALNDFHGALYEKPTRKPGEVSGGLPWVAGLMDAWREEGTPVLVLDGGDLFQGSWTVNASKGMAAVEAFDLLGVDAAAVGNHEFDYGGVDNEHPLRGALERAGRAASWHWLAANIDDAQGKPWAPEGFQATALIERGGLTFGVIGLSTTDTPQTTLTANVADLTFKPVVPVVQKQAEQLRNAGADLIAVVGHLSGSCPKKTPATTGCRPDGEVGALLTELPTGTIDLLITGHSHTRLAFRHDDTIVLQSGSKGSYLGRVDLVVDKDGIVWDNTKIWDPVAVNHAPSHPGCEGGTVDTTPQTIADWTVVPSQRAIAPVSYTHLTLPTICSV